MNPLSPFTYYRRHKRQTLLLMSLISLMTFGVLHAMGHSRWWLVLRRLDPVSIIEMR